MRGTILLIEDEKLMKVTLVDALQAEGYDVVAFETGREALSNLRENSYDLVITDVRLPDIDGQQILREVINLKRDSQVFLMTAYGSIRDAVEAMKIGAYDYITKPFSLDEFLLLTQRALETKRLKEENIRLKKDLSKWYNYPNIIGVSTRMQEVFSMIKKVSCSDSTVLITGESGTGKELIAATIHYQSKRKEKPLIKVNCAAMPEGLIESELFGHEKGAFTGAIKRKPGRFELANTGTVFLDEIGDLPLSTQAKILRVLQERTFERVGGTETLNVDVRVIAATNKNLELEIKRGGFREDLYYRLNVIPISLPPLRERKEDIPYLVDFFLERARNKLSRDISFTQEALDSLLSYDFPGNVRELENIIERSITLSSSDIIEGSDLPPFIFSEASENQRPLLSDISAEAEKEYIIKILKFTRGNRTRAAEILGVSRKNLWEKIKAYRIQLDFL